MKSERLITRDLKKAFETVPGCVVRLLPDSGSASHKKPYDFFILYKGKHISVEAKIKNGVLQPHQRKALEEDAAAGCVAVVFRYFETGFSVYDLCTGGEFFLNDCEYKEMKKSPFAAMVLAGLIV